MMIREVVEVREIQGLYGPMRISERLLQRIWGRRDYSEARLRTLDGLPIRVIRTGSWNQREGPDFLDATLEIGGERVRGDVEIHFRSRNWREHGHHMDPAFSSVILHVILFPPKPGESEAVVSTGVRPPVCAMLEALNFGLEEYAEQEVMRRFSRADDGDLWDAYSSMMPDEREERLREFARERWNAKVKWAAKRLHGTSWVESCHQFFLEILGYGRNRAAMGSIALEHPLSTFKTKMPDPDELFVSKEDEWKLAGIRPQNHPRLRLRQYIEMASRQLNWPDLALEAALTLCPGGEFEETSQFRKQNEMPRRREVLAVGILGGTIGGGRFNTWMVDGLFPLLAAQTGQDLFGWWFHWYAGDAPDKLLQFLREVGVTGRLGAPLCNGWTQGGLGAVTAALSAGKQVTRLTSGASET